MCKFVTACLDCFEHGIPFGTYNLTNPGSVTTREVVELIQASGVCDKSFESFENDAQLMVQAVIEPRSNCVLDSSKAIQAGLKLTEIRQSIQKALATWQTQSDMTN